MIPDTDKPEKKTQKEKQDGADTSDRKNQKKENEKFSPGEPEDYNAEEFATD